ncbi:hypothetical protein [Ruegeria marina]|uniref:Uncharacterized protein n=1 Tax=Ruegeria marina TaxID=639004 RepID=A0A1G6YCW9_9RHOB|nr:hypothetical protein [Ruegeria marina]SDD88172.1 hypothetical protein SAMN04488239_111108 [Ruegeria marina]
MIDALTEVVLASGLQRPDLRAYIFFTPPEASMTADVAAAS